MIMKHRRPYHPGEIPASDPIKHYYGYAIKDFTLTVEDGSTAGA